MTRTRHLVVDISGHGYGHAGMTAPLINAVLRRMPDLRLTIRSTLPGRWFKDRVHGAFELVREEDFGMAMASAVEVLAEESAAAYRRRHADWPGEVAAAAARLKPLKADLLVANVSYLSLAAAAALQVPSVGFSCLNWADVYGECCAGFPEAAGIRAQMLDAYNSAALFLQPAPTMPMTDFHNRRLIGPIAGLGSDVRAELRDRLGLAEGEILVVLAMGGIPTTLSLAAWPRLDGVKVLMGDDQPANHPDVLPLAAAGGLRFIDILRSCDALLIKPGYGLVAESACNGIPTLLLPRPGWPETPYLVEWLRRHNRCADLPVETLANGSFAPLAHALVAQAAPPPVTPTGIDDAAAEIEARLV